MRAGGRLRVLYSFPHALGASGIGTTALKQIEGLRKAGAEVAVVAASVVATVEASDVTTTMSVFGRRVPHRAFGSMERALAYHDGRVARILAHREFDVVHTWPLAATRTLEAARRLGVIGTREAPNTHTRHAYRVAAAEMDRVGLRPARGYSHRFDRARLRTEEAEYALATLVLVPSESVERTFLDEGVPASRLARHQYGYDPAVFRPGTDRRAGFTAIFLGRAEPRKGLHYALEAWQRSRAGVDGGRFLIAGRFEPGYRERLGAALEQPGVEVLGFRTDADELLRSADVLLLPSIEEGSALVVYEAQATGCVPLVSRSAGSRFVDGVEGFVHEDRDVDALAAGIRALQTDAGLRARMRAAAIAGASELTWDAAGRRMHRILAQAVAQNAR